MFQQGLFYTQEHKRARGMKGGSRPLAPIPATGWQPPTEFPNLSNTPVIAFDTETYDPEMTTAGPGWSRNSGYVVGISLATEDASWYFPIAHHLGGNLDRDAVLRFVADALSNEKQVKVGANLLYDCGWLSDSGVEVKGKLYDVQFAEALLDDWALSYSLEALGRKYCGEGKVSNELYEWCAASYGGAPDGKQRANIWRAPVELVGPYAEQDAALPIEVFKKQYDLLHKENLLDVFEMESALIPLLLKMRQTGVRVDLDKAEVATEELLVKEAFHVKAIEQISGRAEVNIHSAEELALAFDAVGVSYPTTAKTNKPSFTQQWLESQDHPLAQHIVSARRYHKAATTFIQNYLLEKQVDGLVHCSFHPLRKDDGGAASGRFSSSDPNLQNIPARDPELGPLIRGLFVPFEGHSCWRKFDYSQIEYRLLVHDAVGDGAERAREMYRNDPSTDFHESTQHLVLERSGKQLKRTATKGINFGLCIAKGQRVLTNRGPVPIEQVLTTDLLWDGVTWVKHDGVVSKGIKQIMTYEGLTATPDHKVAVYDGKKFDFVPLWKAASEVSRLVRTGNDAEAIKTTFLGDSTEYAASSRKRRFDAGRTLQTLRRSLYRLRIQLKKWKDKQVQAMQETEILQSTCAGYRFTGSEIRFDDSAMRKNHTRVKQKLSRPRDNRGVRESRALYTLGFGRIQRRRYLGSGFRPDGQRRKLFSKKFTLGYSIRESTQSAETFDILNAGPRHRFTCEGVLVANCYGMGKDKLAATLGLSRREAEELFAAYHKGVPFVKATFDYFADKALKDGYIETIMGRRSRFALWERKGRSNGARQGLPYEQACEKYGKGNIQRFATHKALNRRLQGSAADLMKQAMVKAHEAGVFDATGYPVVTVHDELDFSDPGTAESADGFKELTQIMSSAIILRVPVLVDCEVGTDWGNVK